MKLIIGNKNYSSWSPRPWLVLTHARIPFEEHKISFNAPDFKAHTGPAGKVPLLVDGDLQVWDSLAIVEYLADRFPDRQLWPADPAARAVARSICAEFHAGFPAVRNNLASNMTVSLPGLGWSVAVQKEIDRMRALARCPRPLRALRGPVPVRRLLDRRRVLRAGHAPLRDLRGEAARRRLPLRRGHRRASRDEGLAGGRRDRE